MGETDVSEKSDASDQPFVSLYRRFRPGTFSELRGQPHVVRALQSAVRDGHVAHAYLFSGPRGTGKTSSARILAKALNCQAPQDGEPCGVCTSCIEIARGSSLDVHELDAASNNGVDAMRDLVAHAALGTPGRWKVYIVDEVHMLSTAAANALLKTLEEPPSHVVFVLATTDPQKVPATIRSRTQHFEFRLFSAETLDELLRDVRSEAGLDISDETLASAVRRGRGSARDALSALDQAAATGSADEGRPEVSSVVEALCAGDAAAALVATAALHEAGWGPQQLAGELVAELRQGFLLTVAPELTDATGAERERLVDQSGRLGLARLVRGMEVLGRSQVDMRDAPDARVILEVALVRLVRPELDDDGPALVERLARLERAVAAGVQSAPVSAAAPTAEPAAPAAPKGPLASRPALGAHRRKAKSEPDAPTRAPMDSAPPPPGPDQVPASDPAPATAGQLPSRDDLVEAWGDHIIGRLSPRAKALFIAGRFIEVDDAGAVFALPNAAHLEHAKDSTKAVEAALEEHFGVRVPLRLVIDEDRPAAPAVRRSPARSGTQRTDDPADLEDDDFDPTDAGDSVRVETVAEARLLEAFPGAEEVTS